MTAAPRGAATHLPPPPGARSRRVRAAKQALHLPIAERYLIMPRAHSTTAGLIVSSPSDMMR